MNTKPLVFLLIGLFFGGGIGFLGAAANNVALDGHHHGETASHSTGGHEGHSGHDHDRLVELPAGSAAPTLDFIIEPDASSGWNLQLVTTNFVYSPDNVNQAHRPGEGHAHVYVNGQKLARLYGPWMHVSALPRGEVTIAVTLNANDHGQLAVAGKPLRTEKTVTVD